MNKKLEEVNTKTKDEMMKLIKLLVLVLVFLGIFYFLTVYIVNKGTKTSTNTKKSTTESEINYKEILAGNSFSVDENQYLVIYYDKSDDDLKSKMATVISNYEAKEHHLSVYTVDTSSAFNKKFVKDESTYYPDNIDELAVNGPTLISFSSKEVVDYIETYESIKEYLE